ncbi:MAG TPA: hypothetical protein VF796_13105, partial [Humisphaera sp.]
RRDAAAGGDAGDGAAAGGTGTRPRLAVLDGENGCGNPDGCQTCLSAAAYSLDASPQPSQTAG